MAMRKSRQNSEFVFWDEWHFVQIDGIIGCDVGNSVKSCNQYITSFVICCSVDVKVMFLEGYV